MKRTFGSYLGTLCSAHSRSALLAGAAAVQLLAGMVGASVPTGVLARTSGLGALGGAAYGLAGGLCALPAVTAIVLLVTLAGRAESGLAATEWTAGVSLRRQIAGYTAAMLLLNLAFLLVSIAGGVLCGAGDAIRQGSNLFGTGYWPSLRVPLLAAASTVYVVVIAIAIALLARRVFLGLAAFLGYLAVFALVVELSNAVDWVQHVVWLLPLAPAYAATYTGGGPDPRQLHLSMTTNVVNLVLWAAIALAFCAYAVRSARFLAPARRE